MRLMPLPSYSLFYTAITVVLLLLLLPLVCNNTIMCNKRVNKQLRNCGLAIHKICTKRPAVWSSFAIPVALVGSKIAPE